MNECLCVLFFLLIDVLCDMIACVEERPGNSSHNIVSASGVFWLPGWDR